MTRILRVFMLTVATTLMLVCSACDEVGTKTDGRPARPQGITR